ncbi:MAG: Nif3-like dinuclear metal center hexameric protein [Eubacteriales bacterium]
MMKISEIADKLNEIAPLDLAENWDNSGFQILFEDKEVYKILLSLDITDAVIEEAVNLNADLIVSHHPMYFKPVKNLKSSDLTGKYTIKLIQNAISAYASHTSFDKACRGTNFYLAQLLGLSDLHFFDEFFEQAIGIYGNLQNPLKVREFVNNIYPALNMEEKSMRLIGNPDAKIKKIGLCTGAGMSEFNTAQKLQCDVFITGDIKYHEAVEALEKNRILIDIGHFDSEKFFVENMSVQLENLLGNKVDIIKTKTMRNPFQAV